MAKKQKQTAAKGKAKGRKKAEAKKRSVSAPAAVVHAWETGRMPWETGRKPNGISKKKRQPELPGTESPDDIVEVDDAIADYMNAKEALKLKWQSVKTEKVQVDALHDGIVKLLRDHERKVYRYRDGVLHWTVRVADKTKLLFVRDHEKTAEEVRPKRAKKGAPRLEVVGHEQELEDLIHEQEQDRMAELAQELEQS